MAWGRILKRLTSGSQGAGLFGYLTSRDQNQSRVKYENARKEATKDIIGHLPDGAVYREGTPDGWREILMPQAAPQLAFMAPEHDESRRDPCQATELPPALKALDQHNDSSSLQGLPRPPSSC